MIALASSLILYSLGKITGISGIYATSILQFKNNENWKYFFLLGLILGGVALKLINPTLFDYSLDYSMNSMILGGLLVGLGTRLGNGCTSGHGVCGLPRRSLRSLVAVLTFMSFGIITVYIKGLL